jgi:hypothetical protein
MRIVSKFAANPVAHRPIVVATIVPKTPYRSPTNSIWPITTTATKNEMRMMRPILVSFGAGVVGVLTGAGWLPMQM